MPVRTKLVKKNKKYPKELAAVIKDAKLMNPGSEHTTLCRFLFDINVKE